MEKSLLLVVLCLQAFLLITAFTSTDAAALVKDDNQQQSPVLVEGTNKPEPVSRTTKFQCSLLPGGCGAMMFALD
ncbi:uncharacterized protein LOC122993417 isoform X1 [Lates japonicus]|uniref:Uncharacterized protein n=1 Tax=Lates japonicus TaxID=270547 RepID=A0AAD3MC20_LATJO|nr:uncharacterized protein AKAME5_000403200 [Lates japonicus]